jgi:cytochrome c oxidase cbb3-type subunit 3
MPAFGRDGILDSAAINDLVSHVRVISRQEKPSAASARGATLFEANCVACHGTNGEGIRELGGPKLTDAVWLYGGSREAIAKTIYNPRNGVMPRWNDKLDAVTIKMLSAYVHSLGGGEDQPAPVRAAAPEGEADNG